jgi:LacI family transcriptional regulator
VILDHLRDHALDGAVVMTDTVLHAARTDADESLPVVLIDDINPEPVLPTIRSANWAGGNQIGRHLISRSRTRPLIVLTEPRFHYIEQRLDGLRTAFREAGLAINDEQIIVSHDAFGTVNEVPDILASLQARAGTFDSVFAIADYLAATVIRSLRRLHLVTPDDVAVVGYDDERAALLLDPPLTTVRQPLHQMGTTAIQTLTAIVAGKKLDQTVYELPGELVVRAST